MGSARVTTDRHRHGAATLHGAVRLLAGLLGGVSAAFAGDGTLDPDFGTVAITTPRSATGFITGFEVLPDGRILTMARASTADADCPSRQSTLIARLNPDGSYDASFGDTISPGRTVLLGFCNEELVMNALAVQNDGRIVLVGRRRYADLNLISQAVAIRLLPNGAIDTDFGDAGLATLSRAFVLEPRDEAFAVALTDSAPPRIVVAGRVSDGLGTDAAAFVLDTQGEVLSVGNHTDINGVRYYRERIVLPGEACQAQIEDLVALPQSTAVVAAAWSFCPDAFGVFASVMLRLDSASNAAATRRAFSFDPAATFNEHGFHTATTALPVDLALDPSAARLWVAGFTIPQFPTGNFTGLAAFRYDLTPDTTQLAGLGRVVLTDIPDFFPSALARQDDGKLLLLGRLDSLESWVALTRVFPVEATFDVTLGDEIPGLAFLTFPVPVTASLLKLGLGLLPGSGDIAIGFTTDSPPGQWTVARLRNGGGSAGPDDAVFDNGFELP